jgi:hypothetical protein
MIVLLSLGFIFTFENLNMQIVKTHFLLHEGLGS